MNRAAWILVQAAALFAFAPGPPALLAAADPYQPTAGERAWIDACLAQHEAQGVLKAAAACVEQVTAACLGSESAPKLPPVPARNSHPESCAPVEEHIWDAYLNDAYRRLTTRLDLDGQGKLRAVQRAWVAYRDRACGLFNLQSGALGIANAAACRLDETARRAIELRGLLGELGQP